MHRRAFLAGMLATPAVVSAGNIWVPPRRVITQPTSILRLGNHQVHVVVHNGLIVDEVHNLRDWLDRIRHDT